MTSPYLPPSGPGFAPPGPVPLDQPLPGATVGEAASRFWRKYATFRGRASRSEYWWWYLVSVLIGLALNGVQYGIDRVIDSGATFLTFTAGSIPSTLWGLATLVPTFAVTTRRLHDIDRSGWWQLLPFAPMAIMLVAALSASRSTDVAVGAIAVLVIMAIVALVCGIVLIVWLASVPKPAGERFDR